MGNTEKHSYASVCCEKSAAVTVFDPIASKLKHNAHNAPAAAPSFLSCQGWKYLAVQGSATGDEWVISRLGLILTKNRLGLKGTLSTKMIFLSDGFWGQSTLLLPSSHTVPRNTSRARVTNLTLHKSCLTCHRQRLFYKSFKDNSIFDFLYSLNHNFLNSFCLAWL